MSEYEIGKDISKVSQRISKIEDYLYGGDFSSMQEDSEMDFKPEESWIPASIESSELASPDSSAIYYGKDLPHINNPDGTSRGRADGNSWFYFGSPRRGFITYGPYVTLEPGAYHYRFRIRYRISSCSTLNLDTGVLFSDATRDGVNPLDGSVHFLTRRTLCLGATEGLLFDSFIAGNFALAERTPNVEIRLQNLVVLRNGINVDYLEFYKTS